MTIRIPVELGSRTYPVLIEDGLLDRAGDHLAPLARDGRLVVVSDENVWTAQGERLIEALARGGVAALPILVAPGEATKSWASLGDLIDRLLDLRLERSDHVVAFGGGMVGDLVGLATALVKRGCGLVQIPTSLLAQVDSSVGGKTGVNMAAGKNMAGVFHQPALVLIDPSTLDTLPARESRAGFAEIVKYGLIGDPGFFAWCEDNGPALISGDGPARLHAIETSVAAKAAIVAEDERESSGRRALLNLGHTFGHALEAETGFSDRLLHGEAVAVGLTLAFRFAAETGRCPPADADRVAACLTAAGLPTSPGEAGVQASGDALAAHMLQDKKASGGAVPFILPLGIGRVAVDPGVRLSEIAGFLDRESRT